jgi:hypothetical protein
MQSRRDQVEAYNYQLARLNSALVRADPDAVEPPGKRETRAFVIGLVVMAIALGGVAGWALLFDSGSVAWKEPGTLIVDKSTGSRYLLLESKLRPVRNLASARLLVGSALDTASVSTGKLNQISRGGAIGIVGAPDMLPSAALLNHGYWRVCLAPTQLASAAVVPATTTSVVSGQLSAPGGSAPGGSPGKAPAVPAAPAAPADPDALGLNVQIGSVDPAGRVGTDRAVLVSSAGKEYLIWNDRRLAIEKPWIADVLGYATAKPVKVPATWLALLSAGPTLEPLVLNGEGGAGPAIGGRATRVGQLIDVRTTGTETRYIVTKKGLAPLNETQFALADAAPGQASAKAITAAQLATAPRDVLPEVQQQLPSEPPVLDQSLASSSPCVEFAGTSAQAAVQVVRAAVPAPNRPLGGASPVSVTVTSGGGALVGTVAGAEAKDQTLSLIDDTGTAYILSEDAITALGYSADDAVYIPARWLHLLPQGPGLSTPGEG